MKAGGTGDPPAKQGRYPCPCCGYLSFIEPPGSYDICPICYWEDDASQLRFPAVGGGANKVSLIEAQQNYAANGACERRLTRFVRAARPDEPRDRGWRPIDPDGDNVGAPSPGIDYGRTYPDDSTALYYWRPTYWRRDIAGDEAT